MTAEGMIVEGMIVEGMIVEGMIAEVALAAVMEATARFRIAAGNPLSTVTARRASRRLHPPKAFA
jgi:hypothetical protein